MGSGNYKYQFVAGNLALDFVNTVAYRADPGKRKDHLQRAEDVRRWANQAQLPDWTAINSGPVGTAASKAVRAALAGLTPSPMSLRMSSTTAMSASL